MMPIPNMVGGFLGRFFVQLIAALVIGPSLAWLVLAVLPESIRSPLVSAVVAIVIGWLGFGVAIGVYLVNRDNHRLKLCARELHAINHIYRDALGGLLTQEAGDDACGTQPEQPQEGGEQTLDPETQELLEYEREILGRVCRRISNIFNNLTGRSCTVTVKLAVMEADRKYCFTWARSDHEVLREGDDWREYSLLTGANTGFDEALKFRPNDLSFFFSNDLWLDPTYRNEHVGWERLYRSTIVVPIRRVFDRAAGQTDLIGFLCVDTRSANRLNGTYKAEFLAAFADQMYNFLSILRGKYHLPNRYARWQGDVRGRSVTTGL